jgi:arylsulfatase A-like enzyme
MLESVDTEIRRLLTEIPAAKRARTTVLLVSDNGTPSTVIDTISVAAIGPAPSHTPLFYDPAHAKGSMYEQGTRVPMIAWGFGVHSGGLACKGLVSTVDIWRTVLDLAGVEAPPSVESDGVSFAHMLANPNAASLRTSAFVQMYLPHASYDPSEFDDGCNDLVHWMVGNQRAITDGRFKYIRQYNPPYQQAFDLSVDPLEKNDIWPWSQTACAATPTTSTQAAIWALRNTMVQLSGM